jgi:hypothetical protein
LIYAGFPALQENLYFMPLDTGSGFNSSILSNRNNPANQATIRQYLIEQKLGFYSETIVENQNADTVYHRKTPVYPTDFVLSNCGDSIQQKADNVISLFLSQTYVDYFYGSLNCDAKAKFMYWDLCDSNGGPTPKGTYRMKVRLTNTINDFLILDKEVYHITAVNAAEKKTTEIATSVFSGLLPNPFNPLVSVVYQLAGADKVQLSVFNSKGERVGVLVNSRQQTAGRYSAVWDGKNHPSGIYLFKFKAGKYSTVKRGVLIK